jgi:hypothetical protein
MAKLTPFAEKYFTQLQTFSGKYIDTLPYIVIGIVISYISVRFIIQWLKNKNEYYTNVTNIPTTTTDPVISYEKPIPTNSVAPKPTHNRRVGLYSLVEPNKRPPGHYNESKVDLLVTNGLFTIGSNWLYDLIFVA